MLRRQQQRGCRKPRGGEEMTYACKLEDFGGQVLENGGNVDSSLGADAHLVLGVSLKETLNTATWELEIDEKSAIMMRFEDESRWHDEARCIGATWRKSSAGRSASNVCRRNAQETIGGMPRGGGG